MNTRFSGVYVFAQRHHDWLIEQNHSPKFFRKKGERPKPFTEVFPTTAAGVEELKNYKKEWGKEDGGGVDVVGSGIVVIEKRLESAIGMTNDPQAPDSGGRQPMRRSLEHG
jgi:hypothetical protein